MSRAKQRGLALVLGLGISALVCVGFWYMHANFVSGVETCLKCESARDIRRYGPLWIRGKPGPQRQLNSAGASIAICSDHKWQRSGSWQVENGAWAH